MLKRMLHRSGAARAAIDQTVTMDAPAYQITQDVQPRYHSTFVHNAVYVPDDPAVRPTNDWLSTPGSWAGSSAEHSPDSPAAPDRRRGTGSHRGYAADIRI